MTLIPLAPPVLHVDVENTDNMIQYLSAEMEKCFAYHELDQLGL